MILPAREALAAMSLTDLAERDVRTCRRRTPATVSRCWRRTDILLIDEPTNHLDPLHQMKVMQRLRSLAAAGKGILVSLHDPALALRFAHSALLLFGDGNWVSGPANDTITPENLARLFGTPYTRFQGDEGVIFLPAEKGASWRASSATTPGTVSPVTCPALDRTGGAR